MGPCFAGWEMVRVADVLASRSRRLPSPAGPDLVGEAKGKCIIAFLQVQSAVSCGWSPCALAILNHHAHLSLPLSPLPPSLLSSSPPPRPQRCILTHDASTTFSLPSLSPPSTRLLPFSTASARSLSPQATNFCYQARNVVKHLLDPLHWP